MGLEELLSFVEGMQKASNIIIDGKPDFIIAPMMGAVPLIDAMCIVNRDFYDLYADLVYYMPASSRIGGINEIMKGWMYNFLRSNVSPEKPISIMTVDEVVSGGSATRVYKAVNYAINKLIKELTDKVLRSFWTDDSDKFEEAAVSFNSLSKYLYYGFLSLIVKRQKEGVYTRNSYILREDMRYLRDRVKEHFEGHISCMGVTIEDSKKGKYECNPRNKEYENLKAEGHFIAVPVTTILTMDKPDYCPPKYVRIPGSEGSYIRFLPKIGEIVITKEYLDLLADIARLSGYNPENVSPVNLGRIYKSEIYLRKNPNEVPSEILA